MARRIVRARSSSSAPAACRRAPGAAQSARRAARAPASAGAVDVAPWDFSSPSERRRPDRARPERAAGAASDRLPGRQLGQVAIPSISAVLQLRRPDAPQPRQVVEQTSANADPSMATISRGAVIEPERGDGLAPVVALQLRVARRADDRDRARHAGGDGGERRGSAAIRPSAARPAPASARHGGDAADASSVIEMVLAGRTRRAPPGPDATEVSPTISAGSVLRAGARDRHRRLGARCSSAAEPGEDRRERRARKPTTGKQLQRRVVADGAYARAHAPGRWSSGLSAMKSDAVVRTLQARARETERARPRRAPGNGRRRSTRFARARARTAPSQGGLRGDEEDHVHWCVERARARRREPTKSSVVRGRTASSSARSHSSADSAPSATSSTIQPRASWLGQTEHRVERDERRRQQPRALAAEPPPERPDDGDRRRARAAPTASAARPRRCRRRASTATRGRSTAAASTRCRGSPAQQVRQRSSVSRCAVTASSYHRLWTSSVAKRRAAPASSTSPDRARCHSGMLPCLRGRLVIPLVLERAPASGRSSTASRADG